MNHCCEDFKDLIEEGIIELDNDQLRSNGWFGREKYVIHGHNCLDLTCDAYIRFCPRCGKNIQE